MKSKEEILAELYEPGDDGGYDLPYILAAMEAYASQDRWISVEERLPELECGFRHCSVDVIVSDGMNVHTAFYSFKSKKWILSAFYNDIPNVTHWQPLPAPHKTRL